MQSMHAHAWPTPPTAAQEVETLARELRSALAAVLPMAAIRDRYRNDPDSHVIMIGPDPWKWVFPPQAQPARSQARRLLDDWSARSQGLLRASAPETLESFASLVETLRSPLDFSDGARGPTSGAPGDASDRVLDALEAGGELLGRVLGERPSEPQLWLVPDTNALYRCPQLERWAGASQTTLVLVPPVLRELDEHKQHHPREGVRRKAQSLLRRFVEYGRRGDTFRGVPIVGSLSFREVAIDTDLTTALDWLRPGLPDDRLLAQALEVKRANPHTPVLLVTGDRGLQNKARLAGIQTSLAPEGVNESARVPQPVRRRALIRVKSASVEWQPERSGDGMAALSVLSVEFVNAGDAAALDIQGNVLISVNGAAHHLGRLDIPVIEANGAYTARWRNRFPPWPDLVDPRAIEIQGGVWHDDRGTAHPFEPRLG
jgi:hypothetical protein